MLVRSTERFQMASKFAVGLMSFAVAICLSVELGCGSGNGASTAAQSSGSSTSASLGNGAAGGTNNGAAESASQTYVFTTNSNGISIFTLDSSGNLSFLASPSVTPLYGIATTANGVILAQPTGSWGSSAQLSEYTVGSDGTLNLQASATVPWVAGRSLASDSRYLYAGTMAGIFAFDTTGGQLTPLIGSPYPPPASDPNEGDGFGTVAVTASKLFATDVSGVGESDGGRLMTSDRSSNGTIANETNLVVTESSIIAPTPDGRFVYGLRPGDPPPTFAGYTTANDSLSQIQGCADVPGSNTYPSVYDILVTPDGHYVLELGDNSTPGTIATSSAVYVFAIDSSTGCTTPVAGPPFLTGALGAGRFTMDPSGQFVLVANQNINNGAGYSDDILVLRFDPSSGSLSKVSSATPVGGGATGITAGSF